MMKKQHYAWIVWAIAAIFYSIEFFQRVSPGVIAQPLMQSFQLSPEMLGFIMSFYFYAYGLAQIPVGLLLDRFGAKISLCFAALAVTVGTYLFASSNAVFLLAIARIIVGIGSAFAFVGCLKLARDWFSLSRFGLIVGLTNTLGVMGALFGEEPLSYFIQQYGWRQVLEFTALLSLIVALLIFLIVKDKPKPSKTPAPSLASFWNNVKKVMGEGQTWLIAVYAGLMVAPVIAFAELWSVKFLQHSHHLSALAAATANSFIFIGIAVGGPLNGWISGRIGRRKPVLFLGNVMALLLFLLIIFLSNAPLHLLELILFLFGAFTSSMLLTFPLNTEIHDKSVSATVIAFTNMMIMFIGAVFQPLIGFLGATSPNLKMALLVLPLALAVNLILLFRIKEQKP